MRQVFGSTSDLPGEAVARRINQRVKWSQRKIDRLSRLNLEGIKGYLSLYGRDWHSR